MIQHVGLTATQRGMTEAQKRCFALALFMFWDDQPPVVHHGDCVGGDRDGHGIALRLGCPVEVHPPLNPEKRAWCEGAVAVHPPKDYMDRNQDIAEAGVQALIACPRGKEEMRSGTWSTVRRARRLGRRLLIIYPGGQIDDSENASPRDMPDKGGA